jgi:hypothetical protein
MSGGKNVGLLTNYADIITRHDRLLRSLKWGDSDYSGNVLAVITSIIGRNPSNAEIIRAYVDHGLEDQLDISSKHSLNPGSFSAGRLCDSPRADRSDTGGRDECR